MAVCSVFRNCGELNRGFLGVFKREFLIMEKLGGFMENSGIWVIMGVVVTFWLEG